jgi:hypothetical protein
MGLSLRGLPAQAARLFARDPRDVLTFAFRRLPRIPRNFLVGIKSRLTSIPRNIPPLQNSPQSFSDLVNYNSIPLADGALETTQNWMTTGQISLLGCTLETGWPPQWQTEQTGTWANISSASINYYGGGVETDIKIVWELQRHQLLPAVASLSKDSDTSTSQLLSILLEWGEQHPPFRTVAWMEGIEVSLRLMSWIDTISRLSNFSPKSEDTQRIARILVEHAKWLSKNLSFKWRLNNNHLLLELVGLVVAGHALDWHPLAKCWRRKGLVCLAKEIEQQTMDGRNWEPTTAYHRFVTEALLFARHSWTNSGQKYSAIEASAISALDSQISKHLDTLLMLTDDDGKLPLVGDDDAGVISGRGGNWDVRSTSHVFDLAKSQGLEPTNQGSRRIWSECRMAVLKESGFHVHLTAGAPEGKARQGSHRHLDMGSTSISLDGNQILIDPGTFTYFGSKQWRDHFRSARVHPGIWSRKIEMGPLRDLFEIPKPPIGEIIEVNSGIQSRCSFQGQEINRTILIHDDILSIYDEGNIPQPTWSFPFTYGTKWKLKEDKLIVTGEGWRLEHGPVVGEVHEIKAVGLAEMSSDRILSSPIDGAISNGYGQIQDGLRLEIEGNWDERRITIITRA